MKNWKSPEIAVLDIIATEEHKGASKKEEGYDGIDAHGSGNKYINKNGTPRSGDSDNENPVDPINAIS